MSRKTSPSNLPTTRPAGISDAEWIVMKVVWKNTPATANQVVDALSGKTTWKPKTIHTLLTRLVKKGFLATTRQGREYQFTPVVEENDCAHAESRSFLDRVFDGKLAPFLACFVERGELTEKEAAELRKILDRRNK